MTREEYVKEQNRKKEFKKIVEAASKIEKWCNDQSCIECPFSKDGEEDCNLATYPYVWNTNLFK